MVGRESLGDLHRPFGIELQTPISIVCGGGVPEPIEIARRREVAKESRASPAVESD